MSTVELQTSLGAVSKHTEDGAGRIRSRHEVNRSFQKQLSCFSLLVVWPLGSETPPGQCNHIGDLDRWDLHCPFAPLRIA